MLAGEYCFSKSPMRTWRALHSLGSQGEHLAGEPVAGGVERRALFAGFGARPGRFLRVQAIGAKRASDGARRIGSGELGDASAGRDGSLVGSLFIAAGGFFLVDMDDPLACEGRRRREADRRR